MLIGVIMIRTLCIYIVRLRSPIITIYGELTCFCSFEDKSPRLVTSSSENYTSAVSSVGTTEFGIIAIGTPLECWYHPRIQVLCREPICTMLVRHTPVPTSCYTTKCLALNPSYPGACFKANVVLY